VLVLQRSYKGLLVLQNESCPTQKCYLIKFFSSFSSYFQQVLFIQSCSI